MGKYHAVNFCSVKILVNHTVPSQCGTHSPIEDHDSKALIINRVYNYMDFNNVYNHNTFKTRILCIM